jgi:RimJ/RimL family protein N-acetyltransferase
VAESARRRGIATLMLRVFVDMHKEDAQLKNFSLICKEKLIPLYEKAGFTFKGVSEVVHGQEQWHNMQLR